MGCTQSKIQNEEIVNRCKERSTMMMESISARDAFAKAHVSYAAVLRDTGLALTGYAEGELDFSDHRQSSPVDAVSSSPPQLLPPPPPPVPFFGIPLLMENAAGSSLDEINHENTRFEAEEIQGKVVEEPPPPRFIFSELDDCFLKASESAYEVSKLLEAVGVHYHSNFEDYRVDVVDKDDFDFEENETHATVLYKMLEWEKKLYNEVKAGELMRLQYQKKIASLNKLMKYGASADRLERAKARVNHLHTRYIVEMLPMDSTVSEINCHRDEQFYPKLVQLVEGLASVWENMAIQHEKQSKIVQALRSLDISDSPDETSEHHFRNTLQLHIHVQKWHSQFEILMLHQKEYIKSLNNWLKLNLIPIDNNLREEVSSPQTPETPPIQTLLRTWHDFLENLPEERTRTAIYNFAAAMGTIYQDQTDEMKMKERCEETRREYLRKARKFEDWYYEYMQGRTGDEMENDKEVIAEQQITVELLKKRLEEELEGYQRHSIQVRDKSLMILKTRLPEVFGALAEFSRASSHMYKRLKYRTELQYSNPNGS